MANQLTDWVVALGFDASEVKQGMKQLDSQMTSYEKKRNKQQAQQDAYERKKAKLTTQETTKLRAQNTLYRKITQAQMLGLDAAKYHNAVEKGSLDTVRKRTAELDKQVVKQDRLNKRQKQADRLRLIEERKVAKEKRRLEVEAEKKRIADLKKRAVAEKPITARERLRMEASFDRLNRELEHSLYRLKDVKGDGATRHREMLSGIQSRSSKGRSTLASTLFVGAEFDDLKRNLQELQTEYSSTRRHTTALTKQFSAQQFASNGLSASLKNLGRSYVSVFAAMAGGASIVQTGMKFEQLKATLLLSAGNANQAAQDFEFLKQTASETKQDLLTLTEGFTGFSIASRQAGLTNKETYDTFKALSITMRASGLSIAESELAFKGFRQMISSARVDAQDSNQVTEQMPQIAGMTRQILIDMGYDVSMGWKKALEGNDVNPVEFTRRLSAAMTKQAVETGAYAAGINSASAAWTDLIGTLKLGADTFFSAGFGTGLSGFLDSLKNIIKVLNPFFKTLGFFASVTMQTFSNMANVITAALSVVMVPFNAFAWLIGDEGNGLIYAVKMLSAYISFTLSKALLLMASRILGISGAAIGGAFLTFLRAIYTGSLTASLGVGFLTKATWGLGAAVTFVLRRLLPLYLAFEGINWMIDKFSNSTDPAKQAEQLTKDLDAQVRGMTSGGKAGGSTNVWNLGKLEVNVSNTNASAQEIGEAASKALRNDFYTFIPAR